MIENRPIATLVAHLTLIIGVLVVIMAAYSLVLDFDFIQKGVNNKAPRKYGWTGAFGIICNMQVTDVSYYFAITGAGQYAIGKSAVAQDDVFLTNNDTWETSSAITSGASSYRIGADCGSNGTLTLYVDGQQIDSVVDTTYTNGNVALFGWSGEQASGTNVSFDDFQMTELP